MIFQVGIDSVEDVLAIRKQAMDALKAGGQVVSWNVNGTSVSKLASMPLKDVLDETAAFLRLVAPDVYGQRIKRTIPVFL